MTANKKKFFTWSGSFNAGGWGFFLKLTKNKFIESEVFLHRYKNWSRWVNVSFCAEKTGDHAGVKFDFCFLWFEFYFHILDRRHWDWDKNTWQKEYLQMADEIIDRYANTMQRLADNPIKRKK